MSKKRRGRLVFDWRDLRGFGDTSEPGRYTFYRKDTKELHSMAEILSPQHTVQLFWCENCATWHPIPYEVLSMAKNLMQTRGISELLQFCINGDPFNFWQPGAPVIFPGQKRLLLVRYELRDEE